MPPEHESKLKEEDKKIDNKSNNVSTTNKVSSTKIILFSVLGVALAPIIIIEITCVSKRKYGRKRLAFKS